MVFATVPRAAAVGNFVKIRSLPLLRACVCVVLIGHSEPRDICDLNRSKVQIEKCLQPDESVCDDDTVTDDRGSKKKESVCV